MINSNFFNIKLKIIKNQSNKTRLTKLLKFYSSNSNTKQTNLPDYIEKIKKKQKTIYFVTKTNKNEINTLFPILKSITKKINNFYIH